MTQGSVSRRDSQLVLGADISTRGIFYHVNFCFLLEKEKCTFDTPSDHVFLFVEQLLQQLCGFLGTADSVLSINAQVHDCPRVAARQAWWRLGGFTPTLGYMRIS